MNEDQHIAIGVTGVSQFVRLNSCERYLRFRIFPHEQRRMLERWGLTLQPLTPLLEDSGARFEEAFEAFLASLHVPLIRLESADVKETFRFLQDAETPAILLQPDLQGVIGKTRCGGRADILRLDRDPEGSLYLHVADVKASRKQRMEHGLQVALYARLAESMASKAGLPVHGISGSVLHMQEDGSIPDWDGTTANVDIKTFDLILERIFDPEDGLIERIARAPFEEVSYHLTYRCDGCLYNAICMYDSAERYDLSLIPGLSAAQKRALQSRGVHTAHQIARLMELPEQGSGARKLSLGEGQDELYRRLSAEWSLAPSLPLIVQRARAVLQNLDRSIKSAPFLFDSGFGSMPDESAHPGLIKVFFDAQKDYLQDRLYLISGLIVGPKGERTVLERSQAPPSDADERDLLIRWVRGVLHAIVQLADDEQAYLHLYCYDRFDQKIVLEALKRHLEDVAAISGFFDLMTQSPALEQPIISFLADEYREHKNLGLTCMPLHDAARYRRFDWDDGSYKFYELFRARLFDNRRNVLRMPDGRITPAPRDANRKDPNIQRIESASRFNSQIPLEYAYAAWGKLPSSEDGRKVLEPFRKVDWGALEAFAAHRVRALHHLEATYSPKSKYLGKEPISLPDISESDQDRSLAKSLVDFLVIEHHTSLQAKEMIYKLPIEQRMQTGLALLLEHHTRVGNGLERFAVAVERVGLDRTLVMNASRLKEGSWVVLNDWDPDQPAGRIKHGRLAIVEGYDDGWVYLRLLDLTFSRGSFRYWHRNNLDPQPGQLYTIDEMADDLNADKVLDALSHASSNALYEWIVNQPLQRRATADQERFYQQFADLVDQAMGRLRLTKKQRAVVAGHINDPLLLVQGPPGTGKTVTLAWAVLARLAEAAAQDSPLRIAVSCKTHNAANIVLEAIAQRLQKLSGFAFKQFGLDRLAGMPVVKIVNDPGETTPSGVQAFSPYHRKSAIANLIQEPWLVIGGTPGGLYNLRRYYSGRAQDIEWSHKWFDLVVIDEASQMSVPEGILSCAFLKPDGRVIVVGDHRQMPPIVAHDWEEEDRRSTTEHQPYLSLFEFLRDRGFPDEGLDQSFRLHKVIAEFLHEHIYQHDGIRFYSRREELMAQPPRVDAYVDAVLDPHYPIVVVEHSEIQSHQYNLTEIELARPLIEVCAHQLRLDGLDGLGIVVPHRAQRAMLRAHFPDLANVESIDTVERFQGGERDVIIVSATASDPDYVLAEADFLLNLNRLNVALSRPRLKLIVIASRSVIELLTSDMEVFKNAVIWKHLYYRYTPELLFSGGINGSHVWVRGRHA